VTQELSFQHDRVAFSISIKKVVRPFLCANRIAIIARLTSAKKRNKHKINMVAPLHRADGSATATANGYTVIAAVNGPLEVQRRDELPEEATIEVNIRPATGVASTS
jgi:uncharacterized protein with FMN-binding domain